MCAFSGECLKVDRKAEYNQDMTTLKAADFDTMIKKLYDRYRPTQNSVLLHYQFHQLTQASGEKVDDFINKICQHAEKCAFKYTNDSCTAKDSIHKALIYDQIIIGHRNDRASKVFEINGELLDNQQQIANGYCTFFSRIGRKLWDSSTTLHCHAWQD